MLADQIGILQHLLMGFRGTDGGNDTLADAGDDRFLTRAADQTVNVGAHGHTGLGTQLNAVLGDSRHNGSLDDLRG